MHPNTFLARHFNHAKRDEAFVIMSFAAEFIARWQQIIEPCIRDDVGLEPKRVDFNQSGESIVHDILDGIAHARIIVADITCSPMKDLRGHLWPQRNGNVMWEVGIAHTMRLPDEVILIQSDNEPSIFDLTQFRAFFYNPNQVPESRVWLSDLVKDRLRSVDQSQSAYVQYCADSLSFAEWSLLTVCLQTGEIAPPAIRTMRDVMGNMSVLPAISRLLEIGALTTAYIELNANMLSDMETLDAMPIEGILRYKSTPLALAIMKHVGKRMSLHLPSLQDALSKLSEATQPSLNFPASQ